MNLRAYIDATYLKTPEDSGLSENEVKQNVISLIKESIVEKYKLIMIRNNYVSLAKEMLNNANSKVLVGTVIDFPFGDGGLQNKLSEANQAINNGVDDLDFVVDYKSFIKGDLKKVEEEIYECTLLGLQNEKVVRWIIEVAALTDKEIIQLTSLVKRIIVTNFKENEYEKVFVKSSTGFFKTQNNEPNGATFHSIVLMLENATPLPVKAAGGVKNMEDALRMIKLGVKRIGTSSQKAILEGDNSQNHY